MVILLNHPRTKLWIGLTSRNEKDLCGSFVILQRYVAAVLYFRTVGENLTESDMFLSSEGLCTWNTGSLGFFCDDIIKLFPLDQQLHHMLI